MQEAKPSLGFGIIGLRIVFPEARQSAQFNATECMKERNEDG